MEAADVCLFASFFMLLCDCMRRRPELSFSSEDRRTVLGVSGLFWMLNIYYGVVLVVVKFSKYTCFGLQAWCY